MVYSCSDFVDSILDALGIEVEESDWNDPSAQADLALAEIDRLKGAAKRSPIPECGMVPLPELRNWAIVQGADEGDSPLGQRRRSVRLEMGAGHGGISLVSEESFGNAEVHIELDDRGLHLLAYVPDAPGGEPVLNAFFRRDGLVMESLTQISDTPDPCDPTVLRNTMHEGWLVSECSDGHARIQRYDCDPKETFSSDVDARNFVHSKAVQCSELHKRAIHLTSAGYQIDVRKAWAAATTPKRIFLVTVRQTVDDSSLDHDDRNANPSGIYTYEADTAQSALVQFHSTVPISNLEDFQIFVEEQPALNAADCDPMHVVRSVVKAVLAYDKRLNDPHGDGTGHEAQAPDGDSYNDLWERLSPLFALADRQTDRAPKIPHEVAKLLRDVSEALLEECPAPRAIEALNLLDSLGL